MISFVAGKLSCLYTSVKLNFEGSFGWSRKESLYYFARQRGPQRANTLRTPCPNLGKISPVQLLSRVRLFATSWTAAHQASLSITNSQSLLRLRSIESVMLNLSCGSRDLKALCLEDLVLCRPLLLLPSIFSRIRVFSSESVLRMRWPKYWSFSFSISPSSEYSGLISFRMDWLDLLAVQGTLKSLSNTTVQKHQFFGTQLYSLTLT